MNTNQTARETPHLNNESSVAAPYVLSDRRRGGTKRFNPDMVGNRFLVELSRHDPSGFTAITVSATTVKSKAASEFLALMKPIQGPDLQ